METSKNAKLGFAIMASAMLAVIAGPARAQVQVWWSQWALTPQHTGRSTSPANR
jgi:hypothetical protein